MEDLQAAKALAHADTMEKLWIRIGIQREFVQTSEGVIYSSEECEWGGGMGIGVVEGRKSAQEAD